MKGLFSGLVEIRIFGSLFSRSTVSLICLILSKLLLIPSRFWLKLSGRFFELFCEVSCCWTGCGAGGVKFERGCGDGCVNCCTCGWFCCQFGEITF